MHPKVIALVPAAGGSTRMGCVHSKARLFVGRQTVLSRSIEALSTACALTHVVIMAPKSELSDFEKLSFLSTVPRSFIVGGQTRQESVQCGLGFVAAEIQPAADTLILVHDAARCLVSPEDVRAVILAAEESGAATLACPARDSIVQVSGTEDRQIIAQALDRSVTWLVQTPQVFRFDLLRRAHEQREVSATDDASLVQKFHPVRIVRGAETNIKITTPMDVQLAEAMLSGQ